MYPIFAGSGVGPSSEPIRSPPPPSPPMSIAEAAGLTNHPLFSHQLVAKVSARGRTCRWSASAWVPSLPLILPDGPKKGTQGQKAMAGTRGCIARTHGDFSVFVHSLRLLSVPKCRPSSPHPMAAFDPALDLSSTAPVRATPEGMGPMTPTELLVGVAPAPPPPPPPPPPTFAFRLPLSACRMPMASS